MPGRAETYTQMTDKTRLATTIGVPELFRLFPDEDTCYRWLERVRWNGEPACPHCGSVENIGPSPSKVHTYWHRDCRKHFTVTTKTCMHATKRPLRDWIYVIYSVMTGRKGVSAMQLSKELGVQYRTAWHMLHRIREACGHGDFVLKDVVDIDETYIGGKRRNMSNSKRKALAGTGPGAVGKVAITGIRERGGKVKATVVEDTDAATLVGLVEQHVVPGTTVYTDEASAYGGLKRRFNHDSVKHSISEYVRGNVHTNGMESVWTILKRSIHGTWHHVSPKHLGKSINEATFRLNDGNCEVDTIDRIESLAGQIRNQILPCVKLVRRNCLSSTVVSV